MAYVDPSEVNSPKGMVKNVKIVKNTEDGGWALATLEWDGLDAVGLRWNGSSTKPGVGSPQSRGKGTWFILPSEIVRTEEFRKLMQKLQSERDAVVVEGYRRMAADKDREREAMEWIEGLESDGLDQAR
jgi:hypothetical protein